MQALQKLLPKYTIIYCGNNSYTIYGHFNSLTMHISQIENNKIIISIHNHFNSIEQFLELNNFVFDGQIYENHNLQLYINIFVNKIRINNDDIYDLDEFYQIIRDKLYLEMLNKPVMINE